MALSESARSASFHCEPQPFIGASFHRSASGRGKIVLYFEVLNGETGGEGGIRTPGGVAPTPHFECGAFDHSATSPQRSKAPKRRQRRQVGEAYGIDGAAPATGDRAATMNAENSHAFLPMARCASRCCSRASWAIRSMGSTFAPRRRQGSARSSIRAGSIRRWLRPLAPSAEGLAVGGLSLADLAVLDLFEGNEYERRAIAIEVGGQCGNGRVLLRRSPPSDPTLPHGALPSGAGVTARR